MDAYTTIRGAEKHSAEHQQQVDRAVGMLQKTPIFGLFDEGKLRGRMAHPSNVLIVSDEAVAVLLNAGKPGQYFKMLCVEEEARGRGLGTKLLQYILATYATEHVMELDCPPERENFYKRHGFHTLMTGGGKYPYMVGPAESVADAEHRLPEGHILRVVRSQPLESLWWDCPECGESNAPTRVQCDCGYTDPQ